MKYPIYIYLFIFCVCGTMLAQSKETISSKDTILQQLNTFKTTEAQLTFLEKHISDKIYAQPKATEKYIQAYDSLVQSTNVIALKAKALNFKGMKQYALESYDKAIETYLKALRLLETEGDSEILVHVYNNLAGCYKIREDLITTEKYFLKALAIANRLKLVRWQANLNNNLAVLYMENQQYDKANPMFEEAIQAFQKLKNILMEGITYMNYGNSRIESEEFKKALENYSKAMELVTENQVPLLHAVSKTGKGIAFTKLKKYREALPLLQEGLALAKQIKHAQQTMESYNAMADYYANTRSFQNAYTYALQAQKLKDSVLNEQQDKNMAEALTKYEAEKKDKEIANQQLILKEKEAIILKRKNQFKISVFAGLLLLLLSFSIFLFYKQRQRIKNKEIEALKVQQNITKLEALIAGEEKERKRIAEDLHDGVNGDLSALKYKFSSITTEKLSTADIKNFEQGLSLLDNSIEQVRRVAHNLTPPSLQNFSLTEAIKQFCIKTNEVHNLKLIFSTYGIPLTYSKEQETTIYRIVQELVTNIVKHANASEALVQINNHDQHMSITVEDNGIGFDISSHHNGIGLKNIYSRVAFLKGTVQIDSNKKGTTVTVEIKNNV